MNIKLILKKIISCVSPRLLASIQYYSTFGQLPNWKAPKDINEKINWLKFYSDTSMWVVCADKYAVREYVEKCGYKENLVNLYGKWDKPSDIDWDSLPSQFVMKMNNGSGDIFICKDKTKVNKEEIIKKFTSLFDSSFSYYNAEPHYKVMKPCIIAEELLDPQKQPIQTDTLVDYKIWCFNGRPYYIWACYNRQEESVEVATYDLSWKRHDEKSVFTAHYKRAEKDLPRPKSLEKMLEIASKLSLGFPQVRVDLYEVDNKPYFGEMTFTSAGGFMKFYSKEFLEELGSYTDISIVNRK